MKSKIVNRILIFGIGVSFFVSGFAFWNQVSKTKNETAKSELSAGEEIEIQDLDCEIPATESAGEMPNYDSLFYKITDDEREVIYNIVAGEAVGEPCEGKMAVAQCLYNAMIKEGKSASEIRTEYQYSGWNDKLKETNPEMYAEVVVAVYAVFANGEFVSDNPILYFYAPRYVASGWHEAQQFDCEIGGHRFFYLEEDINADWWTEIKK